MATFDELAESLARGSTAADRVAAAERLARLDDPRVAPALAKALGDVSPDVRKRVEQLLAEFSRREGDDQGDVEFYRWDDERKEWDVGLNLYFEVPLAAKDVITSHIAVAVRAFIEGWKEPVDVEEA